MPRDIPIIFSKPMVLALLDGRKTMTRRLAWRERITTTPNQVKVSPSPWQRAKPGDRLWVREAAAFTIDQGTGKPAKTEWFLADGPNPFKSNRSVKSRPSIHMPRWASRLTLIVTATKVEPLQAIGEADALAEGAEINPIDHRHRTGFVGLWRSLHGDESWTENPEVVALTFRIIKANVDHVPPHRTHTAALAGGV